MNSKIYLWMGIIGIGVFLVAILVLNLRGQKKAPPSSSQSTSNISPSPVSSSNKFNYQIPAASKNGIKAYPQREGKTVFVSEVLLEKPSYIVISRADEQGKPGKILGYGGIFKAQRYPNITMMLLEETKTGDNLTATIYADNGDGLYKEGEELPVKDEKGSLVMAKFSILK